MMDKITYEELNLLPEIEAYLKPYLEDETPEDVTEQLAEEVKEILLNVVRIKEGVERGGQDAPALDELTKAKMLEWDTEQPAFFAAEKVFKRLVSGRGADGLRFIETKFEQDAEAIRQRHRKIGFCPKVRLDGLTKRLERRLKQKKSLTCKMFIDEIASSAPDSLVDEVDRNAEEVWLVGKVDPVTFGAIANRLTKAKKRLKI